MLHSLFHTHHSLESCILQPLLHISFFSIIFHSFTLIKILSQHQHLNDWRWSVAIFTSQFEPPSWRQQCSPYCSCIIISSPYTVFYGTSESTMYILLLATIHPQLLMLTKGLPQIQHLLQYRNRPLSKLPPCMHPFPDRQTTLIWCYPCRWGLPN